MNETETIVNDQIIDDLRNKKKQEPQDCHRMLNRNMKVIDDIIKRDYRKIRGNIRRARGRVR